MDAKELGNQPAYPLAGDRFARYVGLTKREVFAVAAMQGTLPHPQQDGDPEHVVMWAVKWVDAMLAELAKGE